MVKYGSMRLFFFHAPTRINNFSADIAEQSILKQAAAYRNTWLHHATAIKGFPYGRKSMEVKAF